MAAAPIFLGSVKSPTARILPADASNLVVLWTPGVSASKIIALGISSTDTADRDVALYVTKGGIDTLLFTLKVPLNSGNTNAIPAVDALASAMGPWVRTDQDGSKYLHLESGALLKAKALTTVTAAKEIDFMMHGGDY